MDGVTASTFAVSKTLFLDMVAVLTSDGITPDEIPAEIEGVAFGPEIKSQATTLNTLWSANDNDFLETVADPYGN